MNSFKVVNEYNKKQWFLNLINKFLGYFNLHIRKTFNPQEGNWINEGGDKIHLIRCSCCRTLFSDRETRMYENFCGRCGARMNYIE